jgi:flagellar motor switch protein FliG
MPPEFTGLQKASILLISLGSERSAKVIKYLSDKEIEHLTLEMANMKSIPDEARGQVLNEFLQLCVANSYLTQGGIDFARDVLEKALGEQKAFDIISRLSSNLKMRPFDLLRRSDPKQLSSFVQTEHPQTVALIMTHLAPDKSASLLMGFPVEVQADVTKRIALMGRTSPDVLKEVEGVIEGKITNMAPSDYTSPGGIQAAVDMLNRADQSTQKGIMDILENDDPDLAEQIKHQMFVFEDMIQLDDRSVQLVLREVETKDLAIALKGSDEEMAKKIMNNMSTRAAQMLKEDMQYMGPIRLREVEDAQQRIIKAVRKLESVGAIVISRGGADDIVF